MTAGRVSALAVSTLAVALAGCGSGDGAAAPSATQVPLVKGARVVAQASQCDKGANAFCSLEMVVVAPRFKSSEDLVNAEHNLVHASGWAGVAGDTGDERAADSPHHKLRVTYATAYGDLKGVDLGWIRRSPKIARALSRTLFDHVSAMSIELDNGSS